MTQTQQARLMGFNASLSRRGVVLKLLPDKSLKVTAIIEPVPANEDEFSTVKRAASRIKALRTHLALMALTENNELEDEDSGQVHRITRIEDHPTDIAVTLHCETSPRP